MYQSRISYKYVYCLIHNFSYLDNLKIIKYGENLFKLKTFLKTTELSKPSFLSMEKFNNLY